MEDQDKYPKVLVISNNCFSESSSNGRTLGNFFKGWPKENLAQFYLSGKNLYYDICTNYFKVTDWQALCAFKGGRCTGGPVQENLDGANSATNESEFCPEKKISKNALTALARNIVWRSGRWKHCGFETWVRSFSPDIVLLQAGDFAYMFQLALEVANGIDARLVIYNSEGYYFNDYDYFRGKGIAKMLYPIFLHDLKRNLRKAYMRASHIFYSCDELTKDYKKEFDIPSETIYTASDMPITPIITNNKNFVISYCGNLGLNRHKSLIEVADALQEISKDLFLDVYGKIPNKDVKSELSNCPGIRIHEFVTYEIVKSIITNSDLVLHVESFDEFYKKDLRYGFSTKLADLLSSGKCFLLYAPESLACSRYLIENQAAYVVTEKNKLRNILASIIHNQKARTKYRDRALALAEKNHRGGKNIQRFQSVLKELM